MFRNRARHGQRHDRRGPVRGGPPASGGGRSVGGTKLDRRYYLLFAIAVVAIVAATYVLRESPTASEPPVFGQSDGIWIAVYNGLEVNYTIHTLKSYLRPGDGVALVMHNDSRNWSMDDYFANLLHAALPGITLRAYMSLDGGTDRAGGLTTTIGDLSPNFTQASADWEVNGPVEFDPSFNATVAYFEAFSSIVRASGREAIGYPSGRGVLGDYSGPMDHWNYGSFAQYLNGMTIETQGLCLNASQWPVAVSKIWREYNESGISTSSLSLQISMGVGGNGVNASEASYCANYWRSVDHGNLFLWWGIPQENELLSVLRAIGR